MKLIIILILLIILLIIINSSYLHGYLVGKSHSSKIKDTLGARMNLIIILIILLIILILITLLISNGSYLNGYLVGKSHSSKIKDTFTYINMNEYSSQLDHKEFVNGYMNGLKK